MADDEILTPDVLRGMAKAYSVILDGVANTGVHGLDSIGLETLRIGLHLPKHTFLAMLSQLCQGGLIATDDTSKFFSTPKTAAFVKIFRDKFAALSAAEVRRKAGSHD